MAKMVATKKFSTKPEGKVLKGEEFETDRPEWFVHLGIAKKKVTKRARRKVTPSSDNSE